MLCPGQVYETSITILGQTGAPSNVALTITRPDGTTVAPALGPGAQVGQNWVVTYDYTLPSAGMFQFAWVTQGPGTAPFPATEHVRARASIFSKNEMKLHLNITSTSEDAELEDFMMAATEMIEGKVGICVPRQVTDRVEEGRHRLLLENKPVLSVASVTSVWPGGPSWPGDQLDWDESAGIVNLLSMFPFYWGPWDVVYTPGRQQLPENIIYAGKEQLRHMWTTQRGSMPPALLQGEEEFTATTGFTFTIPRRVLEALEPDIVPAS